MLRLIGLFAIIPMTIFLTISFFVLVVIRKIEVQGLKAFGYVVAALLWAGALLFFSAGIYTIATGRHPLLSMRKMMMEKCYPMMKDGKGCSMMQSDKGPMMKGMMHGQSEDSLIKR